GLEEGPHPLAVGSGEGGVRLARAVAAGLRPEPDIGPLVGALADVGAEIHEPPAAEGARPAS
ncbi:MAG: hypothetical protein ACRD0D_03685, partial [Acidimicrobiales bacterium]